MIQRILLHRTQEYDGLDARIGIPLAFKLKEVDTDATFTEDTGSYCDFYFLNKYRTVNMSQIPEGQNVEEGEKINVNFYGKPVVTVKKIEEDKAMVVKDGEETEMDVTDLKNVDRNVTSLGPGQKAIALYEEPILRSYRCEVLSVGEKIKVKILKHQGYPDNLIRELSQTRVTLTVKAFKEVFESFQTKLKLSSPLELFENLIKSLKKPSRLSRLKKGTIRTQREKFSPADVDLELIDSLFEDLNVQSDALDDNTDVPGNYFSLSEVEVSQYINPERQKPQSWFKDKTPMKEILKNFVNLAYTLTTLEAMQEAFMTPEFLKARLSKTVQQIIGSRDRVQKLEYPHTMLLDINQLYNYSYESLQDYYEGDELDKYIRVQMNPIRNMFSCRDIEVPVNLDEIDEETPVMYAESEYDTDEEESDNLIPERNANSQSFLRESQLVQWPVGKFGYWQKMKDVVDKLLARELSFVNNLNATAREGFLQRGPFFESENEFKSRIACMLTSNGRDFLEDHFDNFRLPSRKDLLDIYDKLRPSLDDIFLILSLRLYNLELPDSPKIGDSSNSATMTDLVFSVYYSLLTRFFSGVSMSFINENDILDFTLNAFNDPDTPDGEEAERTVDLSPAFFHPPLLKLSDRSVYDFEYRLRAQVSNKASYTPVCLKFYRDLYREGSTIYADERGGKNTTSQEYSRLGFT